jgi:hypothetical protein
LKTKVSIAVCVVSILAMGLAYGQHDSSMGRLDIPFKFMVGKKEMPPGKYEFARQGQQDTLLLRNIETSSATFVHVRERLAGRANSEEHHKASVVFDKVGDQRYLSEFWPAGKEDGYLLGTNKDEQKHEVVTQ